MKDKILKLIRSELIDLERSEEYADMIFFFKRAFKDVGADYNMFLKTGNIIKTNKKELQNEE